MNKRFIEQFEENVRLCPDKVILRDEHHSLTFRELDELSGRVYAYLKTRNIGREQSVMINLPRGINVYVAVIGVWKAGACIVLQEANASEDKILYVYNDSQCIERIQEGIWNLIMNTGYLSGYEKTDVHDAAFACYTSGSSGKPKGILHEYGKLEQCGQSMTKNGERMITEKDNFCITISQSSTAEIMFSTVCFYNGAQMTIMPLNILHNIKAMSRFFEDYHVTCAAYPPSILKYEIVHSKYLRWLVVGSEPVRGLYTTEYPLYNLYCQSECAITVATFLIDKAYGNAPIGTATDPNEMCVVDGELYYKVAYTRGYINLPKLTHEVFKDGWCHSGDIARMLSDGNIELLGRKTEMIKINGNRIEPGEIEEAIKQATGLHWVLVKGFEDTRSPFICAYYNESTSINEAQLRERLLQKLPTYMIPRHFIYLDSIPYLPNGKVDRQAFKAPEIEQYRAPYVAPENELEKRLCQEMEQILLATSPLAPLGERGGGIGVLDDFYLLGGDSLRTIELVTNLGIENLTVTDIYAARTPRAIAERWMLKMIAE